ncbi:MAG: DNA replication/repair protein RecF [Acidobacteriota bacterium]
MGRSTETVLKSLRLASFRNIQDTALEWSNSFNLITGNNGQGKTNLLEAVSCLAVGRSFRVARMEPIPRHGQGFFVLDGWVESGGVEHEIHLEAGPGVRRRHLDGKQVGVGETLEIFSCVAFASSRLDLFLGGPEARRRFLDRGLVSLRPSLLRVQRDYARAVRQKNRLLRQARRTGVQGRALRGQIEAFNGQLAAAGGRLRCERMEYAGLLARTLEERVDLRRLVPGGDLGLTYRPSPALEGDDSGTQERDELKRRLFAAMNEIMAAELRAGHALIGPHRDDLAVAIQGTDLRLFGSAGQQRAALLALKMAKMSVHRQVRGCYPVLLVDDVDAELDARRTRQALAVLSGPFQVFVASAGLGNWPDQSSSTLHLGAENGIIHLLR